MSLGRQGACAENRPMSVSKGEIRILNCITTNGKKKGAGGLPPASTVHFRIEKTYKNSGFRKNRGIRDQIANICWIIKKAREFQKKIDSCFIGYAKAFDSVNHKKNCGKFLKR